MVTRRCGVLGRPVAHSLSPVLHAAAYAELGLDWVYDAHDVGEADLAGFLDSLDPVWRGLSLTMPLKRTVVPLVHVLGDQATRAQAANTVVIENGRRSGHNTDVPGLRAALRERYDGPVDRAVVVGGGATAASALLALADLGCRQVTLLVRDPARATETLSVAARHPSAPEVTVRPLGEPSAACDVLVSTVPVAGQDESVLRLAQDAPVVFEVVYDPWPTPLAQRVLAGDGVLVSGLDLLVHQAVLQVELMTGSSPTRRTSLLSAMRAAGEAALAERARLG